MRVAGLGYSDGARNLEVMLESLSGGRRREIQEDGIVMEVKKNYLGVLGDRGDYLMVKTYLSLDEFGRSRSIGVGGPN